jgi:DNA-binding response OmpR family regulator
MSGGKAARIMVINDTEEILESFRDLLEGEGYEVFLYAFAPKELEEVRRVQPELVILDLIFGQEKTGFQLLQKLKMHRDTATIPVVLCTAAIREVRDIEGYLKAQNVGLVPKPFDIDMLLDTVKQALVSSHNIVPPGDAETEDGKRAKRNGSQKSE